MAGDQMAEAGDKPRHSTGGAKSVREVMLNEIFGDIDALVEKLDKAGDKVGKQFAVQVRGAIAELKEENSNVVGALRMTLRENEKGRIKWADDISKAMETLNQLLTTTPPALKRNWWFGFFAGGLAGLSIGFVLMAMLIWYYW
jgi:hypothetical protein